MDNGSPTTQTQEHLEVHRVASSEAGVDDDLYGEDPLVVEAHSRIGDFALSAARATCNLFQPF